jgi:hypothetical protein
MFVTAALSAMVSLFSCSNIEDNGIFAFRNAADGTFSSEDISYIIPQPSRQRYPLDISFYKTDLSVWAVYASGDSREIPAHLLTVTMGYTDKMDEDPLTNDKYEFVNRPEERLVIARFNSSSKTLSAKYIVNAMDDLDKEDDEGGIDIHIDPPQ